VHAAASTPEQRQLANPLTVVAPVCAFLLLPLLSRCEVSPSLSLPLLLPPSLPLSLVGVRTAHTSMSHPGPTYPRGGEQHLFGSLRAGPEPVEPAGMFASSPAVDSI
jgi:hypothetical protein